MPSARTLHVCRECGQQLARWAGRCPGCGAWGTIEQGIRGRPTPHVVTETLAVGGGDEDRVATGLDGVDRVLGGGIVPASVALFAGEPGIGKSTLLLHLVAALSAAGLPCLVASGEESSRQVAARARRIGVDGSLVPFVPGRELDTVLEAARSCRPFLLAVDSIQALRDPNAGQVAGGPSQVRACADALVGLAKTEGTTVVMTGHVTKDGDLAGPRTLEHAVDVVLGFEGDPRSGLRVLASGKNRFGAEGEVAWFEMTGSGLREIDPGRLLRSESWEPGACVALVLAGRRALAVEVQALVVPGDGPARRQASGLDLRRFQMVAAVVERAGVPLGRGELFGAVAGGARLEDPACDLAVAAALASSASGAPPPPASAFVGEIGLTGVVRPAPAMAARLAAARAAGVGTVFAAEAVTSQDVEVIAVRHVRDALGWALPSAVGHLA